MRKEIEPWHLRLWNKKEVKVMIYFVGFIL